MLLLLLHQYCCGGELPVGAVLSVHMSRTPGGTVVSWDFHEQDYVLWYHEEGCVLCAARSVMRAS